MNQPKVYATQARKVQDSVHTISSSNTSHISSNVSNISSNVSHISSNISHISSNVSHITAPRLAGAPHDTAAPISCFQGHASELDDQGPLSQQSTEQPMSDSGSPAYVSQILSSTPQAPTGSFAPLPIEQVEQLTSDSRSPAYVSQISLPTLHAPTGLLAPLRVEQVPQHATVQPTTQASVQQPQLIHQPERTPSRYNPFTCPPAKAQQGGGAPNGQAGTVGERPLPQNESTSEKRASRNPFLLRGVVQESRSLAGSSGGEPTYYPRLLPSDEVNSSHCTSSP
jgi:hypothetical protein